MIKISEEPFTQDEIDLMVSWLNNQGLMKYSEQRIYKHTQASQLKYINSFKEPNRYHKLTVEGNCVGSVSAYIDPLNRIADVGILIGAPYTGKGYGSLAWGIFCNSLHARKIEAGCRAQNKAMIRIFEKNGMRLEGTRRYHFWTESGGYDDMVLYGMLT